jgi:hypothetical protein
VDYPFVNGYMFVVADTTGAAWDSIALPNPQTILTLSPTSTFLQFYNATYSDTRFLVFEITDLSVVPVPGAVLLGAIGLGCSGWLLRRRTT